MEKELMIKIAIVCLALFILYHCFNKKEIPQKKETNQYEYSPLEAEVKETHSVCPVFKGKTVVTACVQYPPFNKGFIVSTCCEDCISTIQKSFKKADNEFSIKYETDQYYLYRNGEKKQIVLECSPQNIQYIVSIVGTNLMGGGNFIKTDTFEGEKKGWVFKKGLEGLGYYKDNPQRRTVDKKYTSAQASHILVSSEAICKEIKREIDAGADFASKAKEHSSCSSSAKGGDLGNFKRGQMVKEFDDVVFSGQPGALYGPVKTKFGYHLILIKSLS